MSEVFMRPAEGPPQVKNLTVPQGSTPLNSATDAYAYVICPGSAGASRTVVYTIINTGPVAVTLYWTGVAGDQSDGIPLPSGASFTETLHGVAQLRVRSSGAAAAVCVVAVPQVFELPPAGALGFAVTEEISGGLDTHARGELTHELLSGVHGPTSR